MTNTVIIRTSRAPVNAIKKSKQVLAPLIDVDQLFSVSTDISIVFDASRSMRADPEETNESWFAGLYERTRWYAQMNGLIALMREIQRIVGETGAPQNFVTEDGANFLVAEDGTPFVTESSFSTVVHSIELIAMRDGLDHQNTPSGVVYTSQQMGVEDYDDIIAYLTLERDTRGRPDEELSLSSGTTDFGAALTAAQPFFSAIGNGQKVMLFFTDGAPFPPETTMPVAIAAAEALADEGVDIYGYNIIRLDTTETALIDNTDADGVPVLTSLGALSWGIWSTIVAPVSYEVTGSGTLDAAAIITRLDAYNPGVTAVNLTLRYVDPVASLAPVTARRVTVPAESWMSLGLEGDVVPAGVALQASCLIGQSLEIVASYTERTEDALQ